MICPFFLHQNEHFDIFSSQIDINDVFEPSEHEKFADLVKDWDLSGNSAWLFGKMYETKFVKFINYNCTSSNEVCKNGIQRYHWNYNYKLNSIFCKRCCLYCIFCLLLGTTQNTVYNQRISYIIQGFEFSVMIIK